MTIRSSSQLDAFQLVPTDDLETSFLAFWKSYPHKIAKGAARKAFTSALKRTTLANILAGVERYKATKHPDISWCHPSTFLHQDRWEDEPAPLTTTHLPSQADAFQFLSQRADDVQASARSLLSPLPQLRTR